MSEFPRRLRIALCTGIFIHYDAISDSLRHKLEILERLRCEGVSVDVTVFCGERTPYAADNPNVVGANATKIRQDPRFLAADVYIFELGIYYELFDAISEVTGIKIVVWHNITPVDPDADEWAQRVFALGLAQQALMVEHADHIICDSQFNREALLGRTNNTSILHLPTSIPMTRKQSRLDEVQLNSRPVHLLYVGRLVPAKGISDLLSAIRRLWDEFSGQMTLTIASNLMLSDPMMHREVARFALGQSAITLLSSPTQQELVATYDKSDVLIMPSHHEGYCIPVIEAMTAGCLVIHSDAGALPDTVGGLGLQYASGDVDALTACLRDFLGNVLSGPWSDAEWDQSVNRYLERRTAAHYERQFLGTLLTVLACATLRADRSPPEAGSQSLDVSIEAAHKEIDHDGSR